MNLLDIILALSVLVVPSMALLYEIQDRKRHK